MVKVLSLLLLSIIIPACVDDSSISHPKIFNTEEFVGFVSMSSDDGAVTIDYELGGTGGNPISFKNCDDVKKTPETDVAKHQYHL